MFSRNITSGNNQIIAACSRLALCSLANFPQSYKSAKIKQVQSYLFSKSQQMRYLNQQAAHLYYAAIGERGVMKTKVIGIALVFGLLAGGLGACNQTGSDGASPSPAESPTTSPTTSP